jgi:hypothetical protein
MPQGLLEKIQLQLLLAHLLLQLLDLPARLGQVVGLAGRASRHSHRHRLRLAGAPLQPQSLHPAQTIASRQR